MYIGYNDVGPSPALNFDCEWKEKYDVVVSDLECIIHHCSHPNIGPG